MQRLADYYLHHATSWEDIRSTRRKFIRDYHAQIHFAHGDRKDQRHSLQDVLLGALAHTVSKPTLAHTKD
jgi:hypothetical protein